MVAEHVIIAGHADGIYAAADLRHGSWACFPAPDVLCMVLQTQDTWMLVSEEARQPNPVVLRVRTTSSVATANTRTALSLDPDTPMLDASPDPPKSCRTSKIKFGSTWQAQVLYIIVCTKTGTNVTHSYNIMCMVSSLPATIFVTDRHSCYPSLVRRASTSCTTSVSNSDWHVITARHLCFLRHLHTQPE
jgi:hypothetical protein